MFALTKGAIFAERYKLIERRGTGGFSEVWEAEDMPSKTIVAIKIFAPDRGLDEDGLEVFKEEYRKCFELKNPYILTIRYYSEYENRPYLLMPLCKKGSLRGRIVRSYNFSELEIATIIFQMATALEYVHKKNIIHQDIKPHNILIDDDDNYQLTDFGSSSTRQTVIRTIARTSGEVPPSYNSFTPAYAPPEVNTMLPHPPGDIFSLGVSLFEVIHQKLPYERMGEAIKNHAQFPNFPIQYSTGLKSIIEQCMQLSFQHRPTATQLVAEAQYYLNNHKWRNEPEPVINKHNNTNNSNEYPDIQPTQYTETIDNNYNYNNDDNQHLPTEDLIDTNHSSGPIKSDTVDKPLPSKDNTNINNNTTNSKKTNKAIWLAPLFVLIVALGGWLMFGNKNTTPPIVPWADETAANAIPEKYRKNLQTHYAKNNTESPYKLYNSPENVAEIDFQLSDGDYKSLACIMRNKQDPNNEKTKIWIIHFDSNGQIKQQPQPYLLDCNQCQTLSTADQTVKTPCTNQQGSKNQPRLIGSNYITANAQPKLVIYKHPERQDIAYCIGE